ncbi:MAG: 4-hydroxythreonine-4-phosphate dehydrogenase PdxA [Planctomycetia bacterium]|nr:4-hydroxythreonine-4-phosphate dehydrogenase PdxA [Planctomycetia bacterium]
MPDKPQLAITLGDPAGIGPEIIVAAWADPVVHELCRPLVVGQPEIVRRAVALLGSSATVVEISSPDEARPSEKSIPCLSAGDPSALDVAPRSIDARGGRAAYDALVAAARLALDGKIDGLVTAPLHKEALHAAGYDYPGHTELLATLCGVERSAMMLYLPPEPGRGGPAGLGVVHVTLHTSLRSVPDLLSEGAIVDCAWLISDVMQVLGDGTGFGTPRTHQTRIGVCALNPHAGEAGLFGDEEQTLIAPAVARARASGLFIEGPLPADTLMVRARDGEFDAVVAMYHDQGHIALKLLGMHRAVNITLGLPIVRTSVAHGTALDRAWLGTAESAGMIAAVRAAATLSRARRAGWVPVSLLAGYGENP